MRFLVRFLPFLIDDCEVNFNMCPARRGTFEYPDGHKSTFNLVEGLVLYPYTFYQLFLQMLDWRIG
ncbi:hypothetical protein CMK12_07850 [Candidatus Poribacteria bacterium]|nr:hypothetical protein [Candidatus Poribacteria bacterium]